MSDDTERDQSAEDREVAKKAMMRSRERAAVGDRVGAANYSELANWALDSMEKRGEIRRTPRT